MKYRRCIFTLTFALLTAPVPLSAKEAQVCFWPAAARPAFKVISHAETFDGVPITVTDFVGAGLRIRADSTGSWVGAGASGGRYSLSLNHYRNQEVWLSFAVFGKDEFLANLGGEAWTAYLNGLRQTHGAGLAEITDVSATENGGGIFLFGQPYREVYYITQPNPEVPATGHRELFAFVAGRLLAFVIEGPERAIPALTLQVDRFLSRLELIE